MMPAGGKLWRMNYRHEGKQKTIASAYALGGMGAFLDKINEKTRY